MTETPGTNRYEYSDKYFLNKLVMAITDNDSQLSATLHPDIDEFITAARQRRLFTASSPDFPDLDERMRNAQLSQDQRHALLMLALCQRHNILPFLELHFDYSFRQHHQPEIKYSGYNFGHTIHDEPYHGCMDPSHFARGSRWYAIQFNEFQGEESIQRAKRAVLQFIRQGYRVTAVRAELQPRIRSGEYVDYAESKATLYANDGVVEIIGDAPGFDAKEIERLELPEVKQPPLLMDELTRKLLEMFERK